MHPLTDQSQWQPFQQRTEKEPAVTFQNCQTSSINKRYKCLWPTSIADIILYPHESIVHFHSGKPSGITGSEFSSYKSVMLVYLLAAIFSTYGTNFIHWWWLKLRNVTDQSNLWITWLKWGNEWRNLKLGNLRTRTNSPHISPFRIWSRWTRWLIFFRHCFKLLFHFLINQATRDFNSFRCHPDLSDIDMSSLPNKKLNE